MYKFSDIVGQDDIKEHLQDSIVLGKVSHAYIFAGDEGSGKKLMARTFAKTLLCEKDGRNACGVCRSCLQTDTDNQPDIKTLIKSKQVPTIGDIRSQVVSDSQVKPYAGKYKVYIIPEAHLLRDDAQNALLKTIEEPPEYVVVILLTNNINTMLSTIVSRCIVLNFKPVSNDKIKSYLMEHCGLPDYAADVNAAFANGKIGLALKYSNQDEFTLIKQSVVKLMENIDRTNVFGVVEKVAEVALFKENVKDYIDLLSLWFRDMLIIKTTANKNLLLFKQQYDILKEQASIRDFSKIDSSMKAIEEAKARLKANVNADIVLEVLFIELKNK